MADHAAALLRAALASARLREPIDVAMERLLAAAPSATVADLGRAILAAERLPGHVPAAARTRQVLHTARELSLFGGAFDDDPG